MKKHILERLSQEELSALYELMFAAASADSHIVKEEVLTIFTKFNLDYLDEKHKAEVRSYIDSPSAIEGIINKLCDSSEELHYAVIYFISEIIVSDEIIEPEESRILSKICKVFGIGDIHKFLVLNYTLRKKRLSSTGMNKEKLSDAMSDYKSALSAAGIPLIQGFVE